MGAGIVPILVGAKIAVLKGDAAKKITLQPQVGLRSRTICSQLLKRQAFCVLVLSIIEP